MQRYCVKVSDRHDVTLERFSVEADSREEAVRQALAKINGLIASRAISRGALPLLWGLAPEIA